VMGNSEVMLSVLKGKALRRFATEGLRVCGGVQAKLTVRIIFPSLLHHPSARCFNRCNKAPLGPTMPPRIGLLIQFSIQEGI
jgi:hypothetical protein